ncbi:DUF3954 domain-containing protein [Weizmannia acidilactici]|uniref:DUF3954 domain-containing protein n=1 Tax=Weizmannia acidilactici TaxID=2607726 RepID=UPI00124CBA24|nr:DUF3954 domain-containing protein [Weizmannia acidilactici]GER73409.1 hypothetical protein BpPP18_14760 [Weizmannia acidilactici]
MAVNVEKMTAEVDLMENSLYVVKDGQITKIEAHQTGFGEYTAVWKDGKVLDVIKSERVRE